MVVRDISTVAWVESPLQLVGAAEWADAATERIAIAGRLTPQMSETADELIARDAPFGVTEPYLGIPWKMLSQHRHWLVGDGFSGQFRLAAAVLRPQRITFLDDGANAIAFADTLLGRREYARPGIDERGLTTRVAPFALDLVHSRALAGRVDLFTAFDLGADRLARSATAACGRPGTGSSGPGGRRRRPTSARAACCSAALAPSTGGSTSRCTWTGWPPRRRSPRSPICRTVASRGSCSAPSRRSPACGSSRRICRQSSCSPARPSPSRCSRSHRAPRRPCRSSSRAAAACCAPAIRSRVTAGRSCR